MKKKIKYYYLKTFAPDESKRWYLVKDYKENFIDNYKSSHNEEPTLVKFTDYKKAVAYKNNYYEIFAQEFYHFKVKVFRKY